MPDNAPQHLKSRSTFCILHSIMKHTSPRKLMIALAILSSATLLARADDDAQAVKRAQADADISNLKVAIATYEIDNGQFPTTQQGLKALLEKPAGELPNWKHPYIDKLPLDPWGRPYIYRCPGTDNKDFDLLTGGPDGHEADIKTNYSITNTFNIGGEGGWDYAIIDPSTHYLYTTRGTHAQVIDTATGKVIADLPKCGAHGIALVPDQNKGFTSDGKANTVTAFDLKSNAILYTVPAGKNPDCIIYDPASKKLFAFDGGSNDATAIDPAAAQNLAVVAHLPLDGKPEFAAADGAGHVYVNIENKNEIQDIDTKSMTVDHTWKIDGDGPTGLAIDTEHHRLFSGTDGKLFIVDYTTGKTVATVPIGNGVDACAYDPATQEAFASCGEDGTLAIIKETSPGKFETVQTVTTKPGARTMALDASTHTVYLNFAAMLPKEAGAKRPKMKPDTFAVLVVGQKS
jgi:type II secretion system protein G